MKIRSLGPCCDHCGSGASADNCGSFKATQHQAAAPNCRNLGDWPHDDVIDCGGQLASIAACHRDPLHRTEINAACCKHRTNTGFAGLPDTWHAPAAQFASHIVRNNIGVARPKIDRDLHCMLSDRVE